MQTETEGNVPAENNGPQVDETGHTTVDCFAKLENALGGGVQSVFDQLENSLRKSKQYKELFEALLMRNRHELGLPLRQIGPATDIPDELVKPHEDAIEKACHVVGKLFLEDGDLVQAWPYLRAIGETEAMKQALDTIEPGTRRKDIDRIVEVAMHEAIHPERGLEIVVHHYGICNAITNFEQYQTVLRTPDRDECARVLIRSLHNDLITNVRAEVERRHGESAAKGDLSQLIADRPELFEGYAYYVDTSHLWSVIRFSNLLENGPELDMTIAFCDYGKRLADVYHYNSEPPFEDFYNDQELYLRGIRGCSRETPDDEARQRAATHFTAKGRQAISEENQDYAMGALLNLLLRLHAFDEAKALAHDFEKLKHPDAPLTPGLLDICQVAKDYERMESAARDAGDVLSFAAGLVQKSESSKH